MNIDLQREAEMRDKLPRNLVELVDAIRRDPGVALEAKTVEILRAVRVTDRAHWTRVRLLVKGSGVSLADLDRVTAPVGGDGDGKQGRAVVFDDPDPWPRPIDGAALLDTIRATIESYTDLPAGGAVASALWALWTWAFDAFDVSPNLMVTAPERESGKTRLTELLSWIVRRAKPVSDASAAAIIRGIERDGPTLLFDEAQSFLKRKADDPIRGILLASFTRRFAFVERVEGDSHEVRVFGTFAPKAMNGRNLARLDDMLTSRSIVIVMTRATRRFPDLRADRDPVGDNVRGKCRRWADDHAGALRDVDPDMGERFRRTAQVWRPLFAVADAAGGDWPGLARNAADALAASVATVADSDTFGVMLLADVREVFGTRERMKSEELDHALLALPERPWKTMRPGDKPMTDRVRGRMLSAYGIQSKTIRIGGDRQKGYERAQFEPAWAAYLSDGAEDSNRDTVTIPENKGFPRLSNRDNEAVCHGSENAGNPMDKGIVTVSRFNRTGGRAGASPERVQLPP